jgi:hypothetical protein
MKQQSAYIHFVQLGYIFLTPSQSVFFPLFYVENEHTKYSVYAPCVYAEILFYDI